MSTRVVNLTSILVAAMVCASAIAIAFIVRPGSTTVIESSSKEQPTVVTVVVPDGSDAATEQAPAEEAPTPTEDQTIGRVHQNQKEKKA